MVIPVEVCSFIFLSVCNNSVMTHIENFRLSKNYKIKSMNDRGILFLILIEETGIN